MTRASDTARLVSGGAVFNEASNDVDFRVEGNGNANVLVVDAGNDRVGIGTGTPSVPFAVSNGTEEHQVAFASGEVYLMGRNQSSYITQEYIANIHAFTGYGDSSSNEAMRIDSSGRLLVGTTQTLFDNAQTLQVSGSQACNMRSTVASADGGHVIGLIRSGNTQGDYIRFFDSSANETGQIRVDSGGVCRYEDVSDYRLKDNIKDWDVDASAKVKQVKIRTFDWKDQTAVTNGKGLVGVIAHELQEVYPHCVSGEKDGYGGDVDKDGNKKPMYQGVDYGKLTPLLTKALQEALARIDTLEAEVTKLKG